MVTRAFPRSPIPNGDELLELLQEKDVHVNDVIAAGLATFNELLAKPNDQISDGDRKKAVIAGKCIGSAVALIRARPELVESTRKLPTSAFLMNRQQADAAPGIVQSTSTPCRPYERAPKPPDIDE